MPVGTAFVDALRAAREQRSGARGLIARALPPLSVPELLGAVLLDDAGWLPEELLWGSCAIVCEDSDTTAAVLDALRGVYAGAVTRSNPFEDPALVDQGLCIVTSASPEEAYDRAVATGSPVVVVTWDAAVIKPREAVTLAGRRLDVQGAGRPGVMERLIEVVTGDAVEVAPDDAYDLSTLDVLRCVHLGSTAAQCMGRVATLLMARATEQDEADAKAEAARPAAAPVPVPVGAAATGVVRRLSKMSGFGEAQAWGCNVAVDLAEYAAGRLPWSDVDRGLLLSGPPGGGKTTFATALSLECSEAAGREVPLVVTTYTDWSTAGGGVGDSMSKGLVKLFDGWRKQATEKGPFVLLIDEIDAMGARGGAAHNESWFAPIITAWLAFLDGAVPRDGIVVVGCTNHVERVDPALRRPGRLDRHVELPMPDVEALAGIVRAHLGPDAMLTDVEVAEAARAVRGRSPAEVGQLAREARRMARWCKRRVCASDLTDAVALSRGAVDEAEDRMVAVHEAGHAVACLEVGADRLLGVDQDKGVTHMAAPRHWDEVVVLGRLKVLLAARAAEEVVLGRTSTGAGRDLQDATDLAVAHQSAWGWGVTGCVAAGRDGAMADPRVMEAVRRTLDAAYAAALDLVRQHRAAVERVAEALQRRRYLDASEVAALVAGPVAGPPRVRRSAPSMGPRIARVVGKRAPGPSV